MPAVEIRDGNADVYAGLDPHNLSTIIGRYDTIGLGLALGAGISFFLDSEGLTIDNVLNYHVVLANGSIVDANATSNPDLFWALKGGNNSFGVVTHFDLRVLHTPGDVYGGIILYPESSLDILPAQEQRILSVYADVQPYKDILEHHRRFLQRFHVGAWLMLPCRMLTYSGWNQDAIAIWREERGIA
ncbi:FAD-binding domain-containing protein [Aspergillus campestris IBT 28561]|uniref:FAD-binding domain-containing protein n=1 Tax=Aspergillus campestris (strain IBT 28561) TaxID=1392248 RepID=A0A2I1DGW8_ASPC2|nr:FAD-binding domain-containing protein [Aspergillus campestris IBT 28561]PKY09117.1 FAD-binding domain-containing protein [Aspergillus campestris IBT 28561]